MELALQDSIGELADSDLVGRIPAAAADFAEQVLGAHQRHYVPFRDLPPATEELGMVAAVAVPGHSLG